MLLTFCLLLHPLWESVTVLFCCTLLCVRSSIAIILMGKRELVALLNLSSWCLVMVERVFFAVPQGCLRFVIVLFLIILTYYFLNSYREYDKIQVIHVVEYRQYPFLWHYSGNNVNYN